MIHIWCHHIGRGGKENKMSKDECEHAMTSSFFWFEILHKCEN
jgi:hypothetical protein